MSARRTSSRLNVPMERSDSGSGDELNFEDVPADDEMQSSPLSPSFSPITSPHRVKKRERTWSSSKSGVLREPVLRTRQRTIYTAGRPPWYDTQGQLVEPFVIGICGGSASGKTTVARKVIEALDVPWVTLLSMDSFYKVLDEEDHRRAKNNDYNFDHPDAFDFDLLIETLRKLKEGKSVDVPIYNFVSHSREKRMKTMYGANVIIFEGILIFAHKQLIEMMDMKVYIETDSDIRLARRLRRDIMERGRDLEGVLKQYEKFVKPAFDYYIAPTVVHADLIVPRGGENEIAISLIVQHVHTQLQLRGLKLSAANGAEVAPIKIANLRITSAALVIFIGATSAALAIFIGAGGVNTTKLAQCHTGQPLPEALLILPSTSQIKGLYTFIRDKNTSRDEFIFYSKRLMRLLIEFSLSLLPFKAITIETPQGFPYQGKRIATEKICGVSILRAGETMEQALCDVLKDVRLGKILIQTNQDTGEPELYYLRLPKDIKDYFIILMDATVATGAAAMMAIRVLLDHDVPEENIMLCSLLMAESGVHTIAYAFPKVKIVTSEVDPEVNDRFYIMPGIGNFGDRYFGTEAF